MMGDNLTSSFLNCWACQHETEARRFAFPSLFTYPVQRRVRQTQSLSSPNQEFCSATRKGGRVRKCKCCLTKYARSMASRWI